MHPRHLFPAFFAGLLAYLLICQSKVGAQETERSHPEKSNVAQVAETDPTKDEALLAFTKVSIPAAEFSAQPPLGGDARNQAFFLRDFGYFRGVGRGGYAYASVTLPEGVKVKNFFAFLYDNDSQVSEVQVSLHRLKNHGGENAQTMATLRTSGNSLRVQIPSTTRITNPVIDGNYSYFLQTYLSTDDTRVYAVYLFYE